MDLFRKLTGLKTLLIDDNEIVRDTLAMVFAYKKCFIKAVATAEEGLRALEEEGFDIIICDFSLPGINGAEFFRRVMAAYPDTVKVLISGYAVENTVVQALETGVDAFLKSLFPYSPCWSSWHLWQKNTRPPKAAAITCMKKKRRLKSTRS